MSDIETRLEGMLFDFQTTYKTDYRRGQIRTPVLTKYEEKPRCLQVRPPPLKDIHTLTAWKSTPVPFSLFHKPHPILHKDPNKVQEPYVKQPDKELAQVIKTRPRIVMTPAVSVDDIEDPKAREILCDAMYTSTVAKMYRDAVSNYVNMKAPLCPLPVPANPVTLPRLQPPYVSPEWRMETVSWDKQQLRSYCDPTKEFWLRQKPSKCIPCEETAVMAAHRKLKHQMAWANRK
ncbi:uncharacterized protein LOC118273120 [Spodoptera frugiperda]|uniref:Uncharacterized protein LOC118273120 n=1 Tax=Spodoptera frugiperda TaxID=7108 RepID=A0A9R0EMW3_SPOFR|nr:uncharacterized protein LOC118273120 [Spodoptera frugiperda]